MSHRLIQLHSVNLNIYEVILIFTKYSCRNDMQTQQHLHTHKNNNNNNLLLLLKEQPLPPTWITFIKKIQLITVANTQGANWLSTCTEDQETG